MLVKSKTQEEFKDKWSLPGGVVENSESFEDGAAREVFEETAIQARVGKCFKTLGEEINLIVKLFLADYISGEINIEPGEITDSRWFNIKELPSLDMAYSLAEDLKLVGLF